MSSGPEKIGWTTAESEAPRWPSSPQPAAGAPNVLVILTDDVGYGSTSTFGGIIPTPTLDELATRGVKYNRFHTTALCSPTRAALLTGRQAHNAGMGVATSLATGYDGYTTIIGKDTGIIAQTLRQHGYLTAAFGKWHLTPVWETSSAGPFDRWPTGQGFDYFYGFLDADTNQFAPSLVENTLAVAPPVDDPDYILDRDLADHTIRWIGEQYQAAPHQPFFVYYATGTAHAPHSAPREWLDKFRGKFDQGWDAMREQIFARQKAMGVIPTDAKLTPRPDFIPDWSSRTPDQKRVFARMMEAYAAALACCDHEIGRILESLKASGQLDNTLVFLIQGDNGASAEGGENGLINELSMINGYPEDPAYQLAHIDDIGGPNAYNHFPIGWAWAMNAPFQYYKQVASHLGGVRNGMVVSWPARLKQTGVVASQFLYVADIVPTIFEVAGIVPPAVLDGVEQKPLDGISFAYTFNNAEASSRRNTQVFEMLQNLGIYSDGWWAGTRPVDLPWDVVIGAKPSELADRSWELYNIDRDYSQADDLALQYPEKLQSMKDVFFAEAAKHNILPIHGVLVGREGRPSRNAARKLFTYRTGVTRVSDAVAPLTVGRSYRITADVVIPKGGASGVLVTHGGRFGGYGLYIKDDRLVFDYNLVQEWHYTFRSAERLTPGNHSLIAEFVSDSSKPGAGGLMTLSVDGKEVASGRIERTSRTRLAVDGFNVGEATLTPLNDDYTISTSKFTGELSLLTFEVG